MFLTSLKKRINWLRVNRLDLFFTLVILLVTSFLAFKNYTPNTYLSGWDNLHPEFNFKLNIERSLNAVWQEYQGVGLLGGMAHAADLPRQVILAGLSFFMPASFIRYFWTFLMLFIGPLGVYFLVKNLLDSRSSLLRVASQTSRSAAAICASFFYLFNLATVQYFFLPFETFVSFYGFLPWLVYFALDYINNGKKLWRYALISILATSAFYVQTLFLVYLIILACLSFANIRRSIWLFLTTFLINSFWLLPVIYFTMINGSVPSASKINSIATPETQYMNLARNDFKSIVTLKGYWFDYYDWDNENQKFDYLYKNWEVHSGSKTVQNIGIGLFIVSLIGLIIGRQFTWIIALGVSYLMLSGVEISIPILSEAFRNSFTKWSVAFSFIVSIGIGYFIFNFKKIFLYLFFVIIVGLSIYQVLPVFDGKLISESMRVAIPQEYFQSFNFLNTRSNGGRVAILPVNNIWGWQFHTWGYRGSGFYWYGIKNPIFDRAFDVWSKQNENFYEELNFALLSNDIETLKNVFKKYQVTYIYYDKNIFNPGYEIKSNFDTSEFKLIATFGNIEIYETGYFDDPVDTQQIDYPDHILKISQSVNINQDFNVEPQVVERFADDQGYQEVKNCDLFEKGGVSRDRSEDGNIYTAFDRGTACDYFYYPLIDNLKPFVIRVGGQNYEGRSLKIYLTNVKTGRVVLEKLMPESKFDEYYLIYPAYFNVEDQNLADGYTLSVETRSFGKITSKNKISTIEIYPVEMPKPQQQGDTLRYDLEILNIKKYGTAIYKVETTGSGVLQLGQGYEEGWIGLIKDGQSWSKLEHLKVNSWSNGWKVGRSQSELVGVSQSWSELDKAGSNGEADQFLLASIVYLVFWPQFLEWGGFLLLLLTFAFIIVKSKKIS